MRTIYKAVQEWENEECEKDIEEAKEKMRALHSEKRQMNQQFETSKRQKTEIIEDDVVLEGEPG